MLITTCCRRSYPFSQFQVFREGRNEFAQGWTLQRIVIRREYSHFIKSLLKLFPQSRTQNNSNYTNSIFRFHTNVLYASKPSKNDRSIKLREEFEKKELYWESLVDYTRLSPLDILIHKSHREAVANRHFTYDDPETNLRVVTRLRHFLKGSCCGNACRHCIYDHENVAEDIKSRRVFNSAFWVDAKQESLVSSISEDNEEVFSDSEEDVDPLLFKH